MICHMSDLCIDEIIDDFHFRSIGPRDKDLFMGVRAEISEVAEFYRKFPDFSDYNWNLILKDENEIGMVVFQQPDGLFVGTCSFQGVQKETHMYFPDREIFVRIRQDNSASRRVAEKNGAVFVKMDDPPEVDSLQKLLDHNDDLTRAEEARAIIERSRNTVRVYKV